jgi:hypothetical protein
MQYSELGIGCSQSVGCSGTDGCPDGVKPDFCIKRNDTSPSFKVSMEDCDGVVDLAGNFVLEVNIWVKSKLKKAIDASSVEINFADNIGFDQIKQNNIISMNRPRNPEKMIITGIDEVDKKILVNRAYDGTMAQAWPKGSELRIFRAVNVQAEIESVHEDVANNDDGTIEKNKLIQTFLVYNFTEDTSCLPGCYWLEFKLTELNEDLSGIVSTRRFPSEGEGFLIRIIDSPTEG